MHETSIPSSETDFLFLPLYVLQCYLLYFSSFAFLLKICWTALLNWTCSGEELENLFLTQKTKFELNWITFLIVTRSNKFTWNEYCTERNNFSLILLPIYNRNRWFYKYKNKKSFLITLLCFQICVHFRVP